MRLYYSELSLANYANELSKIVFETTVVFNDNIQFSGDYLELVLQPNGLVIYSSEFKPFNLRDYYNKFISNRKKTLSRETLLQAIKVKQNSLDPKTSVLDLTAGLGRDSILLSLSGFQVTMLERNPFLLIILNYLCKEFSLVLPELKIIATDSFNYLINSIQSQTKFNIVYFDPMFEDSKQALAKKEMQIIDLSIKNFVPLVENDGLLSNSELFEFAHKVCSNKLVVKRDNKQGLIVNSPKPTYTKSGKTVRFDIYQCK